MDTKETESPESIGMFSRPLSSTPTFSSISSPNILSSSSSSSHCDCVNDDDVLCECHVLYVGSTRVSSLQYGNKPLHAPLKTIASGDLDGAPASVAVRHAAVTLSRVSGVAEIPVADVVHYEAVTRRRRQKTGGVAEPAFSLVDVAAGGDDEAVDAVFFVLATKTPDEGVAVHAFACRQTSSALAIVNAIMHAKQIRTPLAEARLRDVNDAVDAVNAVKSEADAADAVYEDPETSQDQSPENNSARRKSPDLEAGNATKSSVVDEEQLYEVPLDG